MRTPREFLRALTPNKIDTLVLRRRFQSRGLRCDEPSRIHESIEVEAPVHFGQVSCGPSVRVGAYSYVNSGILHSNLVIGRFCSLGYNALVGVPDHPLDWLSTHPVQYEREYGLSSLSYENAATTTLGSDVWLGANVVVRRGVRIGHGAVVASGAIVTRDVDPYTIVAGVPARPMRKRFDEPLIAELLRLEWWNSPIAVLRDLPWNDPAAAIAEIARRQADAKAGGK